jgi:hypothetical protein
MAESDNNGSSGLILEMMMIKENSGPTQEVNVILR